MWWQSRGRSVLSTWVFGCAHGPAGKSSIWGIPGIHGQFSCLPGQTARDAFLQLFSCLLPFPFSPPSHYGLSSEKETDSSSFIMCSQADSHSPPSPSISSARKVVLAHCQTSCHLLCCHHLCHHLIQPPPPQSNPPPAFLVHRWMNLSGILVCYREA